MADTATLKVEMRERTGKGGARATRRAGMVPGIIYGTGYDSVPIAIDGKQLGLEYRRGGFFTRLYDVAVGKDKMRVLPRDVQVHPVTDAPLHIDLMRLTADAQINVDVAVRFLNDEESPGLKRGGVLNVVRHTIELVCRADSIPEIIEIDLTGTEIGDSIHISAVSLPDGVTPAITDRDFTVATVAAPTVIRDEAAEAAEGEEGEEGEEIDGEGAELAEGEEGAEGETKAESDE